VDVDSTSKLRSLSGDSIDLDLDRLASALGSGDTVDQPRAEDEVFSTEVFEASGSNRGVDLDVGEAMNGTEAPTNKLQAISTTSRSAKIMASENSLPELEPVTMSEVGTKLDLARAYMDMGDPEGARSILDEVVQETGSAAADRDSARLTWRPLERRPGAAVSPPSSSMTAPTTPAGSRRNIRYPSRMPCRRPSPSSPAIP